MLLLHTTEQEHCGAYMVNKIPDMVKLWPSDHGQCRPGSVLSGPNSAKRGRQSNLSRAWREGRQALNRGG